MISLDKFKMCNGSILCGCTTALFYEKKKIIIIDQGTHITSTSAVKCFLDPFNYVTTMENMEK